MGVALVALASFGSFPVMIRYGRAFQPDALMVGFVLAGLRGWDEFEATGDRRWAAFGGFVLATGLAVKITSAWALLPFLVMVARLPVAFRLGLAGRDAGSGVLVVSPCLGRGWASRRGLAGVVGQRRDLAPARLAGELASFRHDREHRAGLVVRSFTPVGFGLAMVGLFFFGRLDRLWQAWGVGCALSVAGLAAKWHHGYYWMVVAPARGRRRGAGVGPALGSDRPGTCSQIPGRQECPP